VSDFPRFRSGHGIRPRDWLVNPQWHHVGAPEDLDTLPEDAAFTAVRSVSAQALGTLPVSTRALQLSWCSDVDDRSLALLARLPALEWLFIDHPLHPRLSVAGLRVLQQLPALRSFALRARPEEANTPSLESAHLAPLDGLPLRSLALVNHPALDDLSLLDALPGLETLDLSGCPVRSGLSVRGLTSLHLDGRAPLSQETWAAIGHMSRLRVLSACQREGDALLPVVLPALEDAYLYGSRGLSVRGPALRRLDLGGVALPAPESLADLRVLRLSAHRLDRTHLAALGRVESLWLEGGSPKLVPADWAHLTGCRRLTLSCALKLSAAHLTAIGSLSLEELHIYKGGERLKPKVLSGLAALTSARWIHLEGCRDVAVLRAALPGVRITTEATAPVRR
jgi:hypothetical protein